MLFQPTRDGVRLFFIEVWQKAQHEQIAGFSTLEKMALSIILEHPEYHEALADTQNLHEHFATEDNFFLHLSLHLALEEQLSIDQPFGIRQTYLRLLKSMGDAHEVKHKILECLGEVVWESTRLQRPLDSNRYLECIAKL
jgi:hypothetical protein